jgi:phosphoenolpyruvate-protein phosphotransferase (PTS system enzyme I)
MYKENPHEITLKGIAASPGICIGKAYLLNKKGIDVIKKNMLSENAVKEEIIRFKKAVKKTEESFKKIVNDSQSKELDSSASIIQTHIALLKDQEFYDKVIETISSKKVNAEWAIKKVSLSIKSRFQSMKFSFIKERSDDIAHISKKVMKYLIGIESIDIAAIDKRVILIAHDLSPAETSQIKLDKVKGFVTDTGGKASHTGIIARSLGIPAVMGLKDASKIIKNDSFLIVDGRKGLLILNPNEKTLLKYSQEKEGYYNYIAAAMQKSNMPTVTKDGVSIEILGNIDLSDQADSVLKYGGVGIGLFRTELHYLKKSSEFPSETELFEAYKYVAEKMKDQPVTIRTLDINGDKNRYSETLIKEKNPALGLRAIRYCLSNPDIFTTQLRAILRAAIYGNIRIMFPMISCIEEIIMAKKLLEDAAASLENEKIPHKKDIKIGMMIEVPSAVMIADIFADEVDFFSIGTNDLIQYTLGIDRENSMVAHLFNPLHPGIIRMLNNVSIAAKKKGIKIFICSEMASEPRYLPILLGMGIDGFSMNSKTIPIIKDVIRKLNLNDTKKFLTKFLTLKSGKEIEELINKTYPELKSDERIF